MSEKNRTAEKNDVKYHGTIITVLENGDFGFIGIRTITTEDGGLPELGTTEDVFVHRDECADPLKVGMQVSFYAGEDRRRGAGYCRAFGVEEIIEGELLPNNEPPIPGFYAMTRVSEDGTMVTVPPLTNYHVGVKDVPQETVDQVAENDPLPGIPRGCGNFTDDEKLRLLAAMLNAFFPSLALFNANYNILNISDQELDKAVYENEADLEALGMSPQIEEIREEAKRFKSMKATLKLMFEDGLVRPDTIIPIKNLPDLFMAVPVWYFWTPPEKIDALETTWEDSDPLPQKEIIYFCDLFPNQIWADTYQMFNRRMRSLKMYHGDKVPPFVARRLRKAVEAFDYVVIATPYHQEAGKDWQDIAWLEMIDPYVFGFKKGIPFFFVLARFSDSGTFPLYPEMVADTVEFLKANISKLHGFNRVSSPYWHQFGTTNKYGYAQHGTYLQRHTDALIQHFEKGDLFDWLRGEAKSDDADKQ